MLLVLQIPGIIRKPTARYFIGNISYKLAQCFLRFNLNPRILFQLSTILWLQRALLCTHRALALLTSAIAPRLLYYGAREIVGVEQML